MVLAQAKPDTRIESAVVSVKDASTLFDCSLGTIYDAIHRGEIPHVRIGRKIVIPRSVIDRMLAINDEAGVG